MANVTAAMVKELRDKSGAGMMDCKKALSTTGGDLEKAVDELNGILARKSEAFRRRAHEILFIHRFLSCKKAACNRARLFRAGCYEMLRDSFW